MSCTEKQFLSDIEDHEMKIIKDDEIHRHIRFRRPNTSAYHFDIITWPYHLLITGDMGSFLFSRVEDMLTFFRMDESDFNYMKDRELQINPGYWSEKCLAEDCRGTKGMRQWSPEKFRKAVEDHVDMYLEDKPGKKGQVMSRIQSQVLAFSDNEFQAVHALNDFHSKHVRFDDFWEITTTEYTFQFIWDLYAIVWGIKQYDNKGLEVG